MIQLYTEYADAWKAAHARVRITNEEPSVKTVSSGVILPLRCLECDNPFTIKRFYEGGVVTSQYEFVAGFERDRTDPYANYSVRKAYVPHEIPIYQDETVIFGGLIFNHFGHLLVDGLSRIWYALLHPEYTVCFLSFDNDQNFPFTEYLNLLGLSYIIIENTPVQFRKILVPDEVVFSLEMSANTRWLSVFDYIKNNVTSNKKIDKIYFTRSHFGKKDGVNEEFLEDYYQKQGYTILSPENLTISEQISYVKNAKKIACTIGTLAHLALFAENGIALDVILRDPRHVIKQHLLICAIKKIKTTIIEATKNFLPTHHADGTFFYCPTEYFQKYAKDKGIDISQYDTFPVNKIPEYLTLYAQNYRTDIAFRKIKNMSVFALIDSIHYSLFGKHVKPSSLGFFNFAKAYFRLYTILSEEKGSDILFVRACFSDESWHRIDGAVRMDAPLTTLRVQSKYTIRVCVYKKSTGWLCYTDSRVVGSLDTDEPISALSFNFVSAPFSLCYRIHNGKQWSQLYSDGQDALSDTIYGLQIFYSTE